VGIIDQIAEALHAAHEVNLIHRDVKPSNILVADNDFAYLIDFGIARAAGQTGLTSTSSVIGTWAYMAPERITAGQTDARADIYALACVLYECLTGSQPFGGDSLEQQIGGHLALPPPRASDHRADVPPGLDAVITRGMAKNPDDRYMTTRALAREAKAALALAATGPHTVPPTMAAPLINADTDRTQLGDPAVAGSAPPTGPTQLRPMPHVPNPPGATTSRKRRLIALSSAGALAAIVAVVAAIVLSSSGDHGSSANVSPTSATPSALPNTGPFTGTFTAAMGPLTALDGTAITSPASSPPEAFSETWRLRSACSVNGCVATASTGGRYPAKDLVFDNVDGRWLAITTSRRKCGSREDDEAWNVISLQPQPDGTMSGESTQTTANKCANKRTVVFTRSADTDIALLSDPATLPRRVVSPAEALHGTYVEVANYANGGKRNDPAMGVRTDCLRSGDRCMSFFVGRGDAIEPFVFANGTWTFNVEFESDCSSGGSNYQKQTVTLLLPQPPQNPIKSITGHGYQDMTSPAGGSKCISQALDETFTRTGD
jgi:serine/threonine-protein kinase